MSATHVRPHRRRHPGPLSRELGNKLPKIRPQANFAAAAHLMGLSSLGDVRGPVEKEYKLLRKQTKNYASAFVVVTQFAHDAPLSQGFAFRLALLALMIELLISYNNQARRTVYQRSKLNYRIGLLALQIGSRLDSELLFNHQLESRISLGSKLNLSARLINNPTFFKYFDRDGCYKPFGKERADVLPNSGVVGPESVAGQNPESAVASGDPRS